MEQYSKLGALRSIGVPAKGIDVSQQIWRGSFNFSSTTETTAALLSSPGIPAGWSATEMSTKANGDMDTTHEARYTLGASSRAVRSFEIVG